jgi:hypothetical protein
VIVRQVIQDTFSPHSSARCTSLAASRQPSEASRRTSLAASPQPSEASRRTSLAAISRHGHNDTRYFVFFFISCRNCLERLLFAFSDIERDKKGQKKGEKRAKKGPNRKKIEKKSKKMEFWLEKWETQGKLGEER